MHNPEKLNLDKIRLFNGNNDIVERIWNSNKEYFASILQNMNQYSRGKLLSEIFQNYSWDTYGSYQWNKTSWWWTTPKINTIYWDFIEKYKNLTQLSLDFGFMTHLREFMELAKDVDFTNYAPLEARSLLKEKMGYEEIWRWIMLTDEELSTIKKNWLCSKFFGWLSQQNNPVEQFEAQILSTFTGYIFEKHFHGESWVLSPLLSVTSHKDIAIAVWKHFGNKKDWRKFYLFKLRVPRIDLISYTEHAIKEPWIFERVKNTVLSILIDDKESTYKWDKQIESYIFWKINPDEILEISQPNIIKSVWNDKETIW